ncbi:hypothetical protein [Stutzerimonas sp. 381-2]|tara:strand:+ start:10770 stop:11225 length:456 start_codon:yes stop_codon:yes gene_type:complete
MKKAIFALVAGLSMTTQVIAADAGSAIPSGTAIPATTAGCSLLSEDVTINLSNNVFGAYACNITDNVIAVATCHPTGRKGNVTVSCDPTDANAPAGCAAADAAAPTEGTATVQGGLAFTASSRGGRVSGTAAANCVTGGSTVAEAQAAAGL